MSEKTIGIVGDGQLGRMLVEDGIAMDIGLKFQVIGPAGPESPAAQAGATQLETCDLQDAEAIERLVAASDVTTWEIEHINAQKLGKLERQGANVQPSALSLSVFQDKLRQKGRFDKEGIPVAPYQPLEDAADLQDIRAAFGDRVMVKARMGGYDGRSNYLLQEDDTWTEVQDALRDEKTGSVPALYAEKMIPFKVPGRELSVVGARGAHGIALYPVVETYHEDSICKVVKAPADIDDATRAAAEHLFKQTLHCARGLGLLAVEMFEAEDGQLLVNEVAPRPHNSAHWTDLGAVTSQFEQHNRAILGMELGSTEMRYGAAVMINILTTEKREFSDVMRGTVPIGQGHIRWYGKAPKADGSPRKIGHVTAVGDTPEEAMEHAQELYDIAIHS